MSALILSTKINIPPLREDYAQRPRLLEQCAAGLARKLLLVSAPAGFGKTTLLTAWIHHERQRSQVRFGWLSLDRADSTPARFWTYFIRALQIAVPQLGDAALGMLEASEQPPLENILTVLLNAIAAHDQPLALILDDYHLLDASAIHESLLFFLEHQPSHFHLVLATRIDPPWPLARLRARQQIAELRQSDLRFTDAEAAEFFHRSMQLHLPPEDVAALGTRTEGWIAGLQMAALSLQRQSDARAFVAAFTSSDRYIFDYLLEEVLQQQTPDVQDFLLKTAVLDQMSHELCDAMLERDDGQDILAYLERANLFLIPLDHERYWYRYHHLFAQLLVSHGKKLGLDDAPYHRRASVWLEAHGLPAAALGHALQGRNFAEAARIAEDNALVMLGQGHLGTLAAWLDALPESLTQARPWLCVAHAWVTVYAGKVEITEQWLARAETRLREDDWDTEDGESRRIAGHIALIRSQVRGLRNDHSHVLPLVKQALDLLPPEDRMGRIMAYTLLGIDLRFEGAYDAAETALEHAVALAESQESNQATIFARCHMAALRVWRGHLTRAAQDFWRIIQDSRAGNVASSMICLAYQALSRIECEQNHLDEALETTRQGLTLAEQWGHGEFVLSGYIDLAEVLLAQGDRPGALELMAQSRERSGDMVWPSWLEALDIKMQWSAGNLAAVSAWARDFEARQTTVELNLLNIAIYLMLTRAWMTGGRWPEARDLLHRVWDVVGATEMMKRKLEALILLALTYAGNQQSQKASEILEEALALAEPEGYVRVFLDEGPGIVPLLQAIPLHSPWRGYARHLLAEYTRTDAVKYPAQPGDLIEPLSTRELEILRLLETSMDIQQIAAHLFVAASTVRTHVRNLYAKLGVGRRMEAIQRGKELGLI
jgi:LuxR family maltose regulon positive regulatory protein